MDDWKAALEQVIARTGHEPYRALCAESNPQHRIWRQRMLDKVTRGGTPLPREPEVPQPYPPLVQQAGHALGAVGRVVGAVITGKSVRVDRGEYDRRMGICLECEFMDKVRNRCAKCGCRLSIKPWGSRESCPIGKW